MTAIDNLAHDLCPRPKEKVDKTFLDTNFFNDPKIDYIIAEFGGISIACYLKIVLTILSEGGILHHKIAKSYITRFGLEDDRANAFLECCLEISLLYLSEDGCFYRSQRADREIQDLFEKREKWREEQIVRRGKKLSKSVCKVSAKTPLRLRTESEEEEEEEREHEKELEYGSGKENGEGNQVDDRVLPNPAGQTTDRGGADLHRRTRTKPSRSAVDVSAITYPPCFDTEDCRFQWQRWLTHKAAKNKQYKTTDSMEAKLRSLAKELKTPERLIAAIEHSIGENYEGIFEKRPTGQPGLFNGHVKPTTVMPSGNSAAHEHNLAMIRKYEELEREGK